MRCNTSLLWLNPVGYAVANPPYAIGAIAFLICGRRSPYLSPRAIALLIHEAVFYRKAIATS
jgi:hypothetical protein